MTRCINRKTGDTIRRRAASVKRMFQLRLAAHTLQSSSAAIRGLKHAGYEAYLCAVMEEFWVTGKLATKRDTPGHFRARPASVPSR